ncbi:Hexosyltransferase [Thalictrum thalictroides]|uniref:Hexosyltransferase n=1 Tax=Thalictrum thalictroides TaxID=46969 RepID=A0A7J6W9C0_THATH|nr:Hexosyltransferase [Thalictrum thalictroides]
MHVLEEVEEWKGLGTRTTMVHFDSVPKDRHWEDYFPEWIDEDEKWNAPKCPDIPMPHFKNYGKFNLIVVKVPCGNDHQVKGQGVRDVFRLQVNLVVANLVVNNGDDDDQNVFIVFISLCGPMIEIFRCDDLVRHEGVFWIYKPDLRRLKQKVIMPVGSCQLAVSHKHQVEGKATYDDFSKLSNTIDYPKEAYVTILHSSEVYVCGAIVLAQSIIQSNSTKDLVLLADKSIRKKSRQALKAAGWKIKIIERIQSPYAKRGAYNEWNYSKLRIWQLSAYDKIIFIDSDLIILKNIDKFFLYPQLSAIGNDKLLFNSGIMLVEPSECVFKRLMKEMYTLISYNDGDQGFLNEAFTWWHRWPRRLNFLKIFKGMSNNKQHKVPTSVYSIHYLGLKPWMCYRDYDCNWDKLDHNRYASDSAHWRWWQVYDTMPKKLQSFCGLSKSMDARIKKWRRRAENASLPNRHYKIKVKDPRQHRQ